MVSQMEKILTDLAGNRELLNRLRQQGMSYARACLTWDAKAQIVTPILYWAIGQGPKPKLPPPKMLHLDRAGIDRQHRKAPRPQRTHGLAK